MSFQFVRKRIIGVSALSLICGVVALTLPLGACVSNTVLLKQESGFTKAVPLLVIAENEDRLGMKGRLEHMLLAQGFNVVAGVGERKRLVVTEELPDTTTLGRGMQQTRRVTTDLQDNFQVNHAFRFGYQTDQLGEIVKLTGAIVNLQNGEFVFSYEFQDGLVTPFNPRFLGEELAKAFPDTRQEKADRDVGTLHSKAQSVTSKDAPAAPSPVASGPADLKKNTQSSKVDLVKDIAWQTNLLALNTSVEAARIAIPGHPMAAVANEIKNLADRSMLGVLELGTLMHTPVAAEYRAEELLAQLTPELESATHHLLAAQEEGKNSKQARHGTTTSMNAVHKIDVKTSQQAHGRAEIAPAASATAPAIHPVPTPAPRLLEQSAIPTQLAMVAPIPTPKPREMSTH
ncbi:MAG: methyl-accepting chemotaxis protein [Magnetococcales bacterium]|nr:methyl-accepting chemotaxis protein [Magnetococcales bacterium]